MYEMCMQIFYVEHQKKTFFDRYKMGKITETKIELLIQLDNNIYMQKNKCRYK